MLPSEIVSALNVKPDGGWRFAEAMGVARWRPTDRGGDQGGPSSNVYVPPRGEAVLRVGSPIGGALSPLQGPRRHKRPGSTLDARPRAKGTAIPLARLAVLRLFGEHPHRSAAG